MRPGLAQLRRSPWVVGGFLFLVIAGLGLVWFYANFERKEYEAYEDVSPVARENPLLAAETYLRTLGLPTESRRDMEFFDHLPPTGEIIFIHRLPGALDKMVSDRLYRWAEAGGHLLFVPGRLQSDHPGRGDLTERLGVRFLEKAGKDGDCGCPASGDEEEQPGESAGDEAVAEKKGGDEAEDSREETQKDALLNLMIGDRAIQLKYFHGPLLKGGDRTADFRIGGAYRRVGAKDEDLPEDAEKKGDWLLDYRIGAGRITVLSDPRLFHNQAIGEYDHAFLLSWLLRSAERVWLLHGLKAETLPALLIRLAPQFWLSLVVLLVLAVWKVQQRIGGRLRPEYDDRRNFLAHIDAVGFHHWRMDRAAALLAANRRNILQEWAGRKLGRRTGRDSGDSGDIGDIVTAELAEKSGIGRDEVREAFALQAEREQDLIHIGRAMQKIEMQGKARDR